MAKTRRKTRRHKHRGTQAGTIDRTERRASSSASSPSKAKSRTMTKEERQAEVRRRRAERLDRPPTWRSAINRALLASVVFAILLVAVMDQRPLEAAVLGAFMLLIYVPLGYLFDRSLHRMRMRRRAGGQAGAGSGGARRGR